MNLRSHTLLLSVLITLTLTTGCKHQGEGVVEGASLTLEGCLEDEPVTRFEPFRMELNFMQVMRHEDVVMLNFSPGIRRWPVPDLFALTIDDLALIQEEIESHGSAIRDIEDGQVGISLHLAETCIDTSQSLKAKNGTVTFTALKTMRGDDIRGRVTFDLVDLRTHETVGEALSAEWDFKVTVGTPHQPFADPFSTTE